MEVNLENILSRDCSSRCREDRESSSIRRRRSRKMDSMRLPLFEEDQVGLTSPPTQILEISPSPLSHTMGKTEVRMDGVISVLPDRTLCSGAMLRARLHFWKRFLQEDPEICLSHC